MEGVPDREVSKKLWLEYIQQYEERHGMCNWIEGISGVNILNSDGDLIAHRMNIPERCFIVVDKPK